MENEIYKSPKADLETAIETDNTNLASRGSRFVASIVDALTILPITLPLMYFTGGFEGVFEGQQPSLIYTLTMALVGMAIFLVIHGKIILRDGQSWGKKSQNIKIVTIEGDHADIKCLAKRYGFYWGVPQVPVVGPLINMVNILFIFAKSKRCLHDHVAGTKVVRVVK